MFRPYSRHVSTANELACEHSLRDRRCYVRRLSEMSDAYGFANLYIEASQRSQG